MRKGWIVAALLLGAGPALGQGAVRDAVMEGAARCAGIAEDRAWLDCFYGSAQPMRARLGLAPAPQAQTQLVPPPGAIYASAARPHAAPTEDKGLFAALVGSTRPVAVDMPMQSYSLGGDGRFTVRLANGQTYQQEENDLARAHWQGPPERLLVTVQSAGDKYTLKVKGDRGQTYRVRRR